MSGSKLVERARKLLATLVLRSILYDFRYKDSLEQILYEIKRLVSSDAPKYVLVVWTKRQKNAYFAVRSALKDVYRQILALQKVITYAQESRYYEDFLTLKQEIGNLRIQHYLLEAKKCYSVGSYDATVVMLARALECLLKEYLRKNGISIREKAGLAELIDRYGGLHSGGSGRRIYVKMQEVLRLDRNVGAHDKTDDRHFITKMEADHAWTAIGVILGELLGISYEPTLEI